MLDPKIVFVFYLAAVVCFGLAALAGSGRAGGLGRAGLTQVALVPLGLALYVFPQMWNLGADAF
jgi:hypothetical protein